MRNSRVSRKVVTFFSRSSSSSVPKKLAVGFSFLLIILFGLGCASNSSDEVVPGAGSQPDWYTLDGMFPNREVPVYSEDLSPSKEVSTDLIARGGYLVSSVANCGYCHFNESDSSLSGGKVLIDPSGIGQVPNITPDKQTGIGNWSIDQIVNLLRSGLKPNEEPISQYVHVGYRWMSNRDARAIASYLISLQPVENKIKPAERDYGLFPPNEELRGYVPDPARKQSTVEYGRYLTSNVASCQQCHSPPSEQGELDEVLSGSTQKDSTGIFNRLLSILLTGNDVSPDKEIPLELLSATAKKKLELLEEESKKDSVLIFPMTAPNIRGSQGLVDWDSSDVSGFLVSGRAPGKTSDKDSISKNCPWPAYKGMSARDLQSIAMYIKSL